MPSWWVINFYFRLNEKDDGSGWLWTPYKKALNGKSINVHHFVQCQVQVLAANANCWLGY